MTDEELASWEGLAASATPGPWDVRQGYKLGAGGNEPYNLYLAAPGVGAKLFTVIVPGATDQQKIQDAAFLARARTAVPALAAEVWRLRDLIRRASNGDVDDLYREAALLSDGE